MIYLSVCSRVGNTPPELRKLVEFMRLWDSCMSEDIDLKVYYDAPSIYEGHKENLKNAEPNDICVLLHDDVEILSTREEFLRLVKLCRYKNTGFVGVAGAANLREDAIWWNSRIHEESRGFVFQGSANTRMTPNYFGQSGQVVVLDGCFLACTKANLDMIGLEKPKYLTSDWDFYDLALTMKAYMMGMANYTVPIIIRHVSSGHMRDGWYESKKEFIKEYKKYLPCKINMALTNGLPNQWNT